MSLTPQDFEQTALELSEVAAASVGVVDYSYTWEVEVAAHLRLVVHIWFDKDGKAGYGTASAVVGRFKHLGGS